MVKHTLKSNKQPQLNERLNSGTHMLHACCIYKHLIPKIGMTCW